MNENENYDFQNDFSSSSKERTGYLSDISEKLITKDFKLSVQTIHGEILENSEIVKGIPVLNIKPHYIKHFSKLPFFNEVTRLLKSRSRKTLMLNLFAKAVCRARGHTVIKTDYVKCSHFNEFRNVFEEIHEFALVFKGHFTEETKNFGGIKQQYLKLLSEQFGKNSLVYFTKIGENPAIAVIRNVDKTKSYNYDELDDFIRRY